MVQPAAQTTAKTGPPLVKIAVVAALMAVATLWSILGPSPATVLFYIPIIAAAACFGIPGGLGSAAFAAAVVLSAALLRHAPFGAALWIDLPLFFVFGSVVALLGHKPQTLEHLAYCDPLTGLPDGARSRERLSEEIARTQREPAPLALVLFDIDGLKAINERFDRSHGNRALCETAAAIRTSIRAFDIPGRLEGDEFALLLPDTTRDGAQLVAERIRRAVENRSTRAGMPFTVSAGIVEIGEMSNAPGVASYGSYSTAEYLACAEKALFEARRTGRNRVVFYDAEMYGG